MSYLMREAMIDQDGAVWEKIGGAWSLYKPAQPVPVVGEPVAIVGDPIAILRREIGEDTWFDWTPVKPGSDEHQRLRAAGEMDYCEVYQRYTQSIPAAELERLRECEAALLALKEDCQTSNDCGYGTLGVGHVLRTIDAAMQERKS